MVKNSSPTLKQLWELIPDLPDLQCAFVLLLMCAGPRFNYYARTLPPSLAQMYYSAGHDEGMWKTLCQLLERPDLIDNMDVYAAKIASLPMSKGGLGLRSAARTSPAAYWGS